MDRIKKEESFFGKLLSAVASVNKTGQASIESELALWELLRLKGTELKDQDFDHGAAICKAVQACTVIDTQRQKNSEAAIQNLEGRLTKWAREEVKTARNISDSYGKLHRSYTNSVQKVNQINRDKKVQLSELAVAEKKRDDLKEEWEREGRVGLQSLEHIYDKSRSTLMFALAEYVQSRMDMYSSAMNTLSKIQAHLGELVHFATQQEALQKSSVVQLQSTIQREEMLQREFDAAPRSLHPSLMSAVEASSLFASRCPLSSVWEVKREGKTSKVTVAFDVRTSAMTIGDVTWHVDDILALTKAHRLDSTKVKITFVNREYKDENLSFHSTKDREAFYEMFCLLRRGLANSFVADTKLPVTHEEVKVWTGSWNLGDAPPEFSNEAAMENWMPRNKFDFYVLGLQESEYTPRSGYLTAEDDFFSFMRFHLGDNYLKLAGASLTHIRLVCFVARDHYHKISGVKTATVATGLAGVIGNKGCSAISFSFYDARFCFVGSHLAARIDRKRLEARNQNYRDILKGLASGFSANGLSDVHHEFDYLFWLGDLNYRIDGLTRDEIIQYADTGDIKTLLKHDQLNNERALENCFLEFCEPDITWGPTYRFNRGDRTWSEEKMREPAFCDRVLYKTLPCAVVRNLSYGPCHELMTSDHSPIYSTFSVAVYLPAMPHARDPMCKVSVKDVVGVDLKTVGGSNGGKYSIILQSPWISNQIQANAQSDDGTARWPGEMELFPTSTNRTYLSSRWIRVVVRDGKVDVGVGIIYLEDALAQKGPIRWSCNLADKGRFCGRLSGLLSVTFSPSYEDPWAYRPDPGVLPSYYDLEHKGRPHTSSLSRVTLSESDFKSKQSEHVIERGEEIQSSVSSSTNLSTSSSSIESDKSASLASSSSAVSSARTVQSYGSSPGSAPIMNAKSTGRSWASSRSPRNPPSYSPGGTSTAPSSATSNTAASSNSMPSTPPSNNSKFMTAAATPNGRTHPNTGDVSIGTRTPTSPALNSAAATHSTTTSSASGSINISSPLNLSAPATTSQPTAIGGSNASHHTMSSSSSNDGGFVTPSTSAPASSSYMNNPAMLSMLGGSSGALTSPNASNNTMVGPCAPVGASFSAPHSPLSPHSPHSPHQSHQTSASNHSTELGMSPSNQPAPSPASSSSIMAMNYAGSGIDAAALRKSQRMSAGITNAAIQAAYSQSQATGTDTPVSTQAPHPAPTTNPAPTLTESNGISANFRSALSPRTGTQSMESDLAELESLITHQEQQKQQIASSPSLNSAPLVVARSSTKISTAGNNDDFARELAEFEELLNAKKS